MANAIRSTLFSIFVTGLLFSSIQAGASTLQKERRYERGFGQFNACDSVPLAVTGTFTENSQAISRCIEVQETGYYAVELTWTETNNDLDIYIYDEGYMDFFCESVFPGYEKCGAYLEAGKTYYVDHYAYDFVAPIVNWSLSIFKLNPAKADFLSER